MLEVLRLSLEISRLTDGAFDITSGVLSHCWGFKQRSGSVPSGEAIRNCMTKMGSEQVVLDLVRKTVRFKRSGIELNLGSIGKGFALDRVASMLQNADFGKVLLHAGHSSALAIGDASYPGGGWMISIRNPVKRDRDLIRLRLRDQALGTSGIGEQHFEENGKAYGHIIDPRTGYPATGTRSVTVIDDDATTADAAATALFIAGPDMWHEIAQRMGVKYVLLVDDKFQLHMNPAMKERIELNGEDHTLVISPPLISQAQGPNSQ